jgi:hypothetical protein
MSYSSNYNLNIRLSALESKVNSGGGAGPTTSNLSDVLLNGNSAGASDINMDFEDITNIGQLILTDGVNTNTINQNGYTTRNSIQNLTHYLNFSDSSSTGIGAIQKTAGISCNPSTNTITATNFIGLASVSSTATITDDNTTATALYPTFVNDTGNQGLKIDKTATTLTYIPSTGTLSATTFSGALNGAASQVAVGSVGAGLVLPIPFQTTTGTGNKALANVGGFTYNTSVGTCSSNVFAGIIQASTAAGSTVITLSTPGAPSSAVLTGTFQSTSAFNWSTLTISASTTITGINFVSFRSLAYHRIFLIASGGGTTITINKALTNSGGANAIYTSWTTPLIIGPGQRAVLNLTLDGSIYYIEGFVATL